MKSVRSQGLPTMKSLRSPNPPKTKITRDVEQKRGPEDNVKVPEPHFPLDVEQK